MGKRISIEEARARGNGSEKSAAKSAAQVSNPKSEVSQIIDTSTLFVKGLSFNTTHESLKNLFETCGKVQSAKVVIDKETQKSKGFGYVEFLDV